MNAHTAIIADLNRAALLFPPTTCRQCSGRKQVARLIDVICKTCEGKGGDACQDCSPAAGKPGTGKRKQIEQIVCPNCHGIGEVRRIPSTRPATARNLKVGDWIVIGVEFTAIRPEDATEGSGIANQTAELLSCMVLRISQGIIVARVVHAPEYVQGHGIRYGEQLNLGINHILEHSPAEPDQVEKAKRAGLFTMTVNTIAPVPGQRFYTRDGDVATIWTALNDPNGQYAIGSISASPTESIQWRMDGTERAGNRGRDLVGLVSVVNVAE